MFRETIIFGAQLPHYHLTNESNRYLRIILVFFNLSTSSHSISSTILPFRPLFNGYEIIGDSQMVRLVIQFKLGPAPDIGTAFANFIAHNICSSVLNINAALSTTFAVYRLAPSFSSFSPMNVLASRNAFLFTETAKRIGLCVSGQTVKGLVKLVKHHGLSSDKVVVLIGTNDILQAARTPSPVSNVFLFKLV